MCKPKREGGHRCPIHRYDSTAMVRLVSVELDVPESMVSDVLRRMTAGERDAKMCDPDEWNSMLRSMEKQAKHLGDSTALKRLANARTHSEEPSEKLYSSLKSLKARVEKQKASMDAQLHSLSRRSGVPFQEVSDRYFSALSKKPSFEESPASREVWQEQPVLGGESEDAAFYQVQNDLLGDRRKMTLSKLGFDDRKVYAGFCDGRLEMATDDGIELAYHNVTEAQWSKIQSADDPMNTAYSLIGGHNRYSSVFEAEKDRYLARCYRCGQFSSSSHACMVNTKDLTVITGTADSPILVVGNDVVALSDVESLAGPHGKIVGLEEIRENFPDENTWDAVAVVVDEPTPGVFVCTGAFDGDRNFCDIEDAGVRIHPSAPLYMPASYEQGKNAKETGWAESAYTMDYPYRGVDVELDARMVDSVQDFPGRGSPVLSIPRDDFFRDAAKSGGGVMLFAYTEKDSESTRNRPLDPVTGFAHPNWSKGFEPGTIGDIDHEVTGTAVFERDLTDKYQLLSDREELRCNCADYQDEYDCEHVNYVHAHLPVIINNLVPGEEDAHAPKSKNSFSWLRRPAGSDGVVDFTDSTLKPFAGPRLAYRLSIPREYHNNHSFTEEQIRDLYQLYAASKSMTDYHAVSNPRMVREQLVDADVRVPARVEFDDDATVSGNVVLGRTGDVSAIPSVVSHDLKCTCSDYRENYDCEHMRGSLSQRHLLLEKQGDGYDITGRSFSTFRDAYRYDFEREAMIHTRMEGGMSRSDAETLVDHVRLQAHNTQESKNHEDFMGEADERLRYAHQEVQEAFDDVGDNYQGDYEAKVAQYHEYLSKKFADPDPMESPEEVFSIYRAVRNARKKGVDVLEYQYSNVLGGDSENTRRFGVELEFDIKPGMSKYAARAAIGRELHEAGLTTTDQQREYHSAVADKYRNWSYEKDETVDAELVSPILSDDEQSWKQLEQVCEIITRNGGIPTVRTGSHVHVSAGTYGMSGAKPVELIRVTKENEDTLFRLASNPHTGKHRGRHFCASNIVDVETDIPPTHEALYGAYTRFEDHPSVSLTGTVTSPEKDNVEFRMWDATLDPKIIQQQVKISAAMMDHAEHNVVQNNGSPARKTVSRPLGNRRLEEDAFLKNNTYDAESFHDRHRDVLEFMRNLFPDAKERDSALRLFFMTKWQKV